ncbi:MAG TPA: TMEM175 family protein, partial [bacterium]|nr:TMEM175 family protein [bacterium]
MLSNQALDPHFRWRGHEVTRVEAFSDAVFAFAMTLLVVSLEVPKNLSQLLETMRGFPAFATCFTILVMLWYWHYKFFRRFGLQDRFTIVWNAALLFVVLFFVYPLKFVMTLVVNMMMGVTYEQPPI